MKELKEFIKENNIRMKREYEGYHTLLYDTERL